LTPEQIDCRSQKGDRNAEKHKAHNRTDRNLLAAGWNYLRVLPKFKHGAAPNPDPFTDHLGKFTVPV
jgi:hypothetical protein